MRELTEEEKANIPYGEYCYRLIQVIQRKDGLPKLEVEMCPYWYRNEYDCGDCQLMDGLNGENDGEFDCLLDDQCKCCGVNEPDDSEYV